MKALLQGNMLTLVGTELQLKEWIAMKDMLDKEEESANVMHSVQVDEPLQLTSAVLWLVTDHGSIESLVIDQSQLDEGYDSRLYRRVRLCVSISCEQFEMSRMLE